jgi:hypothetical protein
MFGVHPDPVQFNQIFVRSISLSILILFSIAVEWVQLYFLFRSSQIQMSAQKSAILSEIYRGFPQFLQSNNLKLG